MKRTIISLCTLVLSAPVYADPPIVIWSGSSSDTQNLGVAAASLVDAIMAEQQRIKTQPIVYRKIGIKPAAEGAFEAKPGDILARQVEYSASFIGRPTEDFKDSYGMPLHRASMTTVKMVNGGFCFASGSKCFFDLDRNGTWDRAGQTPKGRPQDVPYEVLELRRENPGGLSRELRVEKVAEGSALLREMVSAGAGLAQGRTCEISVIGPTTCEGFRITVLEFGDGWIRAQIDPK
ncbi:MAG TPA: hypothetical protein VLE27_09035 [Thermoanaerobaculia bacterium]|nr:hypothetical protein [Thermoanaerobaculia bacterium]